MRFRRRPSRRELIERHAETVDRLLGEQIRQVTARTAAEGHARDLRRQLKELYDRLAQEQDAARRARSNADEALAVLVETLASVGISRPPNEPFTLHEARMAAKALKDSIALAVHGTSSGNVASIQRQNERLARRLAEQGQALDSMIAEAREAQRALGYVAHRLPPSWRLAAPATVRGAIESAARTWLENGSAPATHEPASIEGPATDETGRTVTVDGKPTGE